MTEYCSVCKVRLGFGNKGFFGGYKLLDGFKICSNCYSLINEIDKNKYVFHYTLEEAENIYETHQLEKLKEINPQVWEMRSQIRKMNPPLYSFADAEMNQLPNVLLDDEKIIHAVEGCYNNDKNGILFATDSRIIFFRVDPQGNFTEIIPYEDLDSIKYLSNEELISITTKEKIVGIIDVDKYYGWQFCEEVNRYLSKPVEKKPEKNKPDMQNIQYQVRKINPDLSSWLEKDIDGLSDILMDNENIVHIIDGLNEEKTAVILLSTEKRFIIKGIGIDFIEVIDHEKVKLLEYVLPEKKISIHTDEKIFSIDTIDEVLAPQFCEVLNALLFGSTEYKSHATGKEDASTSAFELLEQLGKLRDNGILTEEEFTDQKKKILDRL